MLQQQGSLISADGQSERWRDLLSQLTAELETQQAYVAQLELQNRQLREVTQVKSVHDPPPLSRISAWSGSQAEGPERRSNSSLRVEESARSGLGSALASPNLPRVVVSDIRSDHSADSAHMAETSSPVLAEGMQESASMDVGDIDGMLEAPMPMGPSKDFRQGPATTASLLEKRRVQMMIMRAEKTRKFTAEKRWYVINPESNRCLMVWQMVTTIAMVFVALITPLQVGLFEMQVDLLLAVSLCIDVIFLADMILQFFTMYPKRTARGVQWEHSLGKISRHYMKTWFALDFITLIPWDVISLIIPGANNLKEFKGIKIMRALRLLKLMRIFRTSKVIHKLEIALSIPYQQMALIKFLLVLMLVCHWLSCLWAMTLGMAEDAHPQWIDDIATSDAEFGINTKASPVRIYVAAFYFCSYTMTSVGYGDIGPQNIMERMVCIAIVLIAGLCWAYILGEVGAIVTDINSENQGFRKKMNSLNRMMQERGLPQNLRRRLRSYFLQNKHQAQFVRHQKLLESMSPQLQAEVSTAMNLQWLNRVWFFRQFMKVIESKESQGINTDLYRACISDISHQIESRAFAQEEMFGDVQVLYILSKGLVALNSKIGLYGAVWGEDFVLSDATLIRRVSAFALTYLEVLILPHKQFMEVVERRKSTCPQLAKIVRQYCVRVATRRGILSEAQKRNKGRSNSRHNSANSVASAGPARNKSVPPGLCPVCYHCPAHWGEL
ncbi:unc-103 [Symbiodinium necroappetens]|uniref:Unc-103 protein n=1 Tax=Symbiodinium necroappetens TaxID=1628268 RepID=A0A812K2G6_9DINO|nr:unc-103 [Symbiodinium necroappetens]